MNQSNRLIVRCCKDVASMNICDSLVAQGGWDDYGSDDLCTYVRRDRDLLMTLPAKHLYTDDLDVRARSLGFVPDVVIFPSVHSAESGRPALTAHPIGNFNDAIYGGRLKALVPAAPAMMTQALRLISARNGMPEFSVCFEATHHGPWLETPTFFLEIGSDISNWPRKDAGELQAGVLRDCCDVYDYPVVFGVGGGHYAPRFSEMAVSMKVNFAHMLPNYQLEGRTDEEVVRMLNEIKRASGTDMGYLHRKSMKGAEAQRLRDLGESVGVQWMRSEDFEALSFS